MPYNPPSHIVCTTLIFITKLQPKRYVQYDFTTTTRGACLKRTALRNDAMYSQYGRLGAIETIALNQHATV